MDEDNLIGMAVNIDEAINITAGTRKYQKIMVMIIALGPFTVTSIIVSSQQLLSNSFPIVIMKSPYDLDTLWDGQEIAYFRNFIVTGVILGSFFIPYLADIYGRKRIIKVCCILNAFCLTLVALSVNVLMLLIAGFGVGICLVGVFIVGIVMCVESVDFKQRGWYLGLYATAFYMSSITTILLTLLDINWRAIVIFYALLALIEFFLLKYIAESPRFLLVNIRNIVECKKALNKISLMNGEGPFLYSLESENNRKNVLVSFKDLYRSRMNIIKLIACSVIWFTMLLAYYLTVFNINKYYVYPNIQNILMNLIDISSNVVAVHLINNYGRKKTLFYCLLIEGTLFLCISLTDWIDIDNIFLFILFLALNFVAGLVYMLITIFTAEQFPTYMRCTCFGISIMIGRFGTVIAANLDLIGLDHIIGFPTLAAGILILCISSAVVLLEETHHKELDEMAENTNSILLLDKTKYNR